MSAELFPPDDVQAPSPRLKWLAKHGVHVALSTHCPGDDTPWEAWTGDLMTAVSSGEVYCGATDDDAITAWAKANNVRLWNEE